MSTLPVTHLEWQVLRAIKRSHQPPGGRQLRLTWSRRTKDGSFLTALVRRGLLVRVTGDERAPFEATYALTSLGEYAAEYGECGTALVPPVPQPPPVPTPSAKPKAGRKPSPRHSRLSL